MDMDFHHDFVISPSHSAPNLLQWKYKPSSTEWLKTSPSSSSPSTKIHDVFQNYFATVSQDANHWLARRVSKVFVELCLHLDPIWCLEPILVSVIDFFTLYYLS